MEDYHKGHRPIKAYFYIQKGVGVINDFKYVGAGIFAIYFALKLQGMGWLVGLTFASIPILFILGWLYVHKMSKALDWLGVQYSTYWSRYSFELMEKQVKLLEKLLDK